MRISKLSDQFQMTYQNLSFFVSKQPYVFAQTCSEIPCHTSKNYYGTEGQGWEKQKPMQYPRFANMFTLGEGRSHRRIMICKFGYSLIFFKKGELFLCCWSGAGVCCSPCSCLVPICLSHILLVGPAVPQSWTVWVHPLFKRKRSL